MPLNVSKHALERFREHHPEAEKGDVHQALHHGNKETPELVQALCQRKHPDHLATYISSEDRRGIFVIRDHPLWGPSVVTYLRLSEERRATLLNILKPVTPKLTHPVPTRVSPQVFSQYKGVHPESEVLDIFKTIAKGHVIPNHLLGFTSEGSIVVSETFQEVWIISSDMTVRGFFRLNTVRQNALSKRLEQLDSKSSIEGQPFPVSA